MTLAFIVNRHPIFHCTRTQGVSAFLRTMSTSRIPNGRGILSPLPSICDDSAFLTFPITMSNTHHPHATEEHRNHVMTSNRRVSVQDSSAASPSSDSPIQDMTRHMIKRDYGARKASRELGILLNEVQHDCRSWVPSNRKHFSNSPRYDLQYLQNLESVYQHWVDNHPNSNFTLYLYPRPNVPLIPLDIREYQERRKQRTLRALQIQNDMFTFVHRSPA